MQNGKIKFYNKQKRYGFVTGEDGVDYFFHDTGLANGIYVRDDEKVAFNVTETDRGKKAIDISLID